MSYRSVLGLVVWLAACRSTSDLGTDGSALAREEPEMTKVVFINDEPEYDLCAGHREPSPREIIRPTPPGDAAPFDPPIVIDAFAPDEEKPCKCAYWDGTAWQNSPPDWTAVECVTEIEPVYDEVCGARFPRPTMSVKRCVSSSTTCEEPQPVALNPINGYEGSTLCAAQAADACNDVTYTGKAIEHTACEFCKWAAEVVPATREPDTDYYEWRVDCEQSESAEITQEVTQDCETRRRTLVHHREPRDGWSVTNLCESCPAPPPGMKECARHTCQVIRISAADDCEAGVLFTGKCVTTGTALTDLDVLPVPPPPEYMPQPWTPGSTSIVPPDAGVPMPGDGGVGPGQIPGDAN
jgi:hypothetical protein